MTRTMETLPGSAEHPPPHRVLSWTMRWGAFVTRRKWWVLSVWGVLLLASFALYPHLLSSLGASDYSVTGSDSQKAAHILQTDFSALGAEQDVVTFDSKTLKVTDPQYAQTVDRVLKSVRGQPGVVSLTGPNDPAAQDQVSADGRAALATLGLSGTDPQRLDRTKTLQDTVRNAAGNGPVKAYLTGYSPTTNDLTTVETSDQERAESIGIPVAFIVLLVALATVIGALIPLLAAMVAIAATFGILSALAFTGTSLDPFLEAIIVMLGVGIAIDYSLFIISRFREELARARRVQRADAVPTALGIAMTTSGKTIAFSGTIVVISLFSLFLVNSPFFHGIAMGAVLVVVVTLLTAWTMLPAFLATVGNGVNKWQLPKRWRPSGIDEPASDRPNGWARWAHTVLRHPWFAIPAVALLVVLALPMFGMKLGIDMGVSSIADTPSGKGATVLTNSFSPGVLSPIQIVATHNGSGSLSANDLATIDSLTTTLSKDSRVDKVYSVSSLLNQAGGQTPQALASLEQDPNARSTLAQEVNVDKGSNRAVVTVISKAPVDSTQASNLVRDIRNQTIPSHTVAGGPQMLVGGETAQFLDLSHETMSKLPWVLVMVLSLSFLYLLVVFRSLLVPTKAVVMNLLVTGATFGLTTWVFQEGHLSSLFGFTSAGFIQVYLPVMVFAVIFGLSMDYEVFLMGRMREQWLRTHDNDDAVATGVARTGRAITAAALIMTAVFGAFLIADVLELKEFGLALAAAVILDATLVRLLMVPAIMKVAGGSANWWLPKFLRRILPTVRVD